MTQYHYLDESGDPGLDGSTSSSSHFALAMVQLAERAPLPELAFVRQTFHLSPTFEFKYHDTRPRQKAAFEAIQAIPFRIRAVAVDKSGLEERFFAMRGQDFTIEFISHLALCASIGVNLSTVSLTSASSVEPSNRAWGASFDKLRMP